MESTKLEATGAKHTNVVSNLKSTIENLDAMRPKVADVDWTVFDMILNNTDFTSAKNTLDAMKMFYNQLWIHVVFPHQEEHHLQQRETGRLILEADRSERRAKKAEQELETLRESLQEEGEEGTREA